MMNKRQLHAWSAEAIGGLLMVRFGKGRRGGIDTAAAADYFEISRRTVQRWMKEGLPAERVDAVRAECRPAKRVVRQEGREMRVAIERARMVSARRGRQAYKDWHRAGWLKEHYVAVVDLPTVPLSRVVMGTVDGRQGAALMDVIRGAQTQDLVSRRGREKFREQTRIASFVTVPNRFDARVLKGRMLAAMDEYRVQAPEGTLYRGNTETWLRAADCPPLTELLTR